MNWKISAVLILIAVAALLGLGALLHKTYSKADIVVLKDLDTLYIYIDRVDTLILRSPAKVEYVTREVEVPKGCDDCFLLLERCQHENLYLSEIEVTGVKQIPEGEITVGFSVPRFIKEPSTAFTVTANIFKDNRTLTVYEYLPQPWYDRIGAGPYIGYGIGGRGPDLSVGVSLHYQLFKPSDMWR